MSKQSVSQEKPIGDCWNRIGVWGDSRERCPKLAETGHCRNCHVYSYAGRRLLERPIEDVDREEWTVTFASPPDKKETTIHSAFIFRAGGEWLGLPARLIQEVVDMGKIHSLPHRDNTVLRGLVNIRGKLEICFSIGAVLGIDRFEKPVIKKRYISPERLVVVASKDQRIVFPVSEVFGTYRYAEGMLQQLPITVSGSKAAFSKGILCVNDFEVGFLNEKILFDTMMRHL
ncbi:MAG TPA: chemotaxis protein CheW [Desulfobulbus sp.]|nr:chemotaxis protein CheW [Desulfobulbus sp.]